MNRSIVRLPVLLGLLACLPSGCSRNGDQTVAPHLRDKPGGSPALLRDMTATSGIDFTYKNGEEADHYSILESLGGGMALFDYDGDGLLDIFITGGGYFGGPDKKEIRGYSNRLYKNLGGWKFKDVTAEVGLDQPIFYTHGCAVADYDRDGWPDLLVTGYGRVALFHNEPDGKGGRRFVEVTHQAGLHDKLWSASAAWADFDGDGFPDLFICHYVDWSFANNPTCNGDICPPKSFKGIPAYVYRNNGDGTFTEVGKEAGVRQEIVNHNFSLGVVAVDLNGDGKPDVYVCNDSVDNYLYINRSTPGKIRFEELGLISGTAYDGDGAPNGSMGVDAADYDGCGRPSLLVTNFQNESHALYHNECKGSLIQFRYTTRATGIAALGLNFVGFGVSFFDLDNDGWEDVVIANGHVMRHPVGSKRRQNPVLLRNEGGRFKEITVRGGPVFQQEFLGRGVAIGDLDNDGWPDVVISRMNEPVILLRNVAKETTPHHWLGIELAGKDRRDVTGARIVLDAGGRKQTRFAKGGGSYLSARDPRLLFGLGTTERIDKLTVIWPSGREQHWDSLAVDRYHKLTED
jgi:enediyne biosynthesis protein E4